MKTWEIVLLAVGSPIWLALAIAAAAIVISVFAVIWSVLVALWAVPVSLIACLPAGVFTLVIKCIAGDVLSGLAMLGIGLAASGLSVFAVYGCIWATKGTWALSKLIIIGIKSMFIGREDTK